MCEKERERERCVCVCFCVCICLSVCLSHCLSVSVSVCSKDLMIVTYPLYFCKLLRTLTRCGAINNLLVLYTFRVFSHDSTHAARCGFQVGCHVLPPALAAYCMTAHILVMMTITNETETATRQLIYPAAKHGDFFYRR